MIEAQSNDQQMKFELINTESFHIIGMECMAEKWDGDGSIGRLWSNFLERIDEIRHACIPSSMYGICEHETCGFEHFRYMAAIGVDRVEGTPPGMVARLIRRQRFFQACVPNAISVPDAYTGTIGVARSLGYTVDDYDNIEVYEDSFQDPAYNSFKLLIPIQWCEGESDR